VSVALPLWERGQLALSRRLLEYGRQLGDQSQFGG
jgi:hypothetical protein